MDYGSNFYNKNQKKKDEPLPENAGLKTIFGKATTLDQSQASPLKKMEHGIG